MMAEAITILYFCLRGVYICERSYDPPKIVYQKAKSEDGCYKDGIFYPRCKDLDNPDVLYYHNLFKGEK